MADTKQTIFKQDLAPRLPIRRFQYVDVEFGSTADEDLIIRHKLSPIDPEKISWLVVRQYSAGQVYKDTTSGRKEWGEGFIVLRSDTASFTCRLLLFIEES